MADTQGRRHMDDPGFMTEIMVMYPEVWFNHRQLAVYVTDWAQRVLLEAHGRHVSEGDAEYLSGYHQALADIVAHLRRGDALPGGPICRAVGAPLTVVAD